MPKFLSLFAVIILLGAGCAPGQQPDTEPTSDAVDAGNAAAGTQLQGTPPVNDTPDADLNVGEGGDLPAEGPNDTSSDNEAMMEQAEPGSFEPYAEEKVSRAAEETVVLAFLADWCPSCRAFKQDVNAQLDEIPSGVTILEVDYDEETELKQKYGIRTQHTFVEVDAEGNKIQMWTGANRLSDLVERVQ